jgi:hypothetical protein
MSSILFGGLLCTFGGVTHGYFTAFLQAMQRFLRFGGRRVCAVHGGATHELEAFFVAISGLHDGGLGTSIDSLHGPLDRTGYTLGSEGADSRQQEANPRLR